MTKTVINSRFSIVPLYALKCFMIHDKAINGYIENEHGIALFDKQKTAKKYIEMLMKKGA